MVTQISKMPTWILFLISVLPFMTATTDPKIWTVIVVMICIFFAYWFYSIVITLTNNKDHDNLFSLNKFKLILMFALLYVVFVSVYYVLTLNKPENLRVIFFVILPGHIFLAYSYFYLLNFISKVISTSELQKPVKFNEYIGYFICLLFFPVGIWWLNPKLKSLLEKD